MEIDAKKLKPLEYTKSKKHGQITVEIIKYSIEFLERKHQRV